MSSHASSLPLRRALRTGFTLTEMILTMVVLSVFALAMASYVARMTRSSNDEQARAEAFRRANLAAQYLSEQLRPAFCLLNPATPNNNITPVGPDGAHGVNEYWVTLTPTAGWVAPNMFRWRDQRIAASPEVYQIRLSTTGLVIQRIPTASNPERTLLPGITRIDFVMGRNPAPGDWGVRAHRYAEIRVSATSTVGGVTKTYTATSNAYLRNSDP